MSIRKLAGQTAIYGVSSIAVRMLNYLLTPYFTRVMAGRAEYGVVTDMYALIPFALVLLTLGLESGYFRFAGKAGSEGEKKRIFATAWGAVIAVSVVFTGLVFLFNRQLADVMEYSAYPSYVWLVGGIIGLDAIAALPFARLREQNKAMRFVLIRFVSVVLNIILCVFFFSVLPRLAEAGSSLVSWYDPAFGAGYVLVANIVVSFLTLFMLLPSVKGIWPKIDRKLLGTIMIYSLPLLVSGIAGTANEFIDRQMIKYLMPKSIAMEALGVYGAVVKIGVLMVLFTQMYRLAAEPYFLSSFKKDDFVKTNAEAMKYFIMVALGIFLMIMLFVDLFGLIIDAKFREGLYILPVLLVGNILSGVVLNLSFWYKQMSRTGFALLVTGTGLVFTIVFNILLVPKLGIYGAALARLICEVVMVVVSYALNRKYCPTPYDLRSIGIYVVAAGAIYAVGMATAGLPEIPKYLCNLALLAGYGIFAVRREKIDVAGLLRSVIKKQ